MSETRRETLKILGAIGATCAFPFPADELYGQHVHVKGAKPAAPRTAAYKPSFFGAVEYELISRLADLIIPATDTAGALGAGVPEYVDRVVSLNPEHQGLMRAGLEWIDLRSRELFAERFLDVSEAQQIQILQPLSDEVDRRQRATLTARYRGGGAGGTFYAPRTDEDGDRAASRSCRGAGCVAAVAGGRAGGVLPPAQEPHGGRLLHVPRRSARRARLQGQHRAAQFPSCTVPEH